MRFYAFLALCGAAVSHVSPRILFLPGGGLNVDQAGNGNINKEEAMSLGYKTKTLRPASMAAYLAGALVPALVMVAGSPAVASDTLVPIAAITLPNGQHIHSFDISFVDPVAGLYVLGDRTNKAADVINTHTLSLVTQAGKGKFIGFTGNNNTSGPDGVLFVNHKQIWVGDGNSTMKVMSLANPQKLIANISTGGTGRVDEMCFDPVHQKVMAANNADDPPFGTIFDVATLKITHQLKFDGNNGTFKSTNGAEQCQWSPRTHKFYITIPGINSPDDGQGGVIEIDPVSGTVTAKITLPLSSCSAPQGMAIGPGHQILIGCNGGPNSAANGDPVVVIDDGSGAAFGTILATVKHEVGADMVDYNAASNQYTLARSTIYDATSPQSIGSFDATSFAVNPDLVSGKHGGQGNHSIASDKATNRTFFPVADTSGSTLCSSVGGIDAQGCILVLITAVH
jgi:hypothetical protein